MNLEDLTDWLLEHYGRESYQPGLSRIRRALGNLVSDLNLLKIVTIAGTNGKGETTLRLSEQIKPHPHCVWTSPHIQRLTERFRDEEGEIGEEELKKLLLDCHEIVKKNEFKLTYYEFLFFAFCHWSFSKRPDYLLLEVGLGGRLDAVNVLDADLVLLPSISRDHQEFLGNRYDLILKEKLGVLRPKRTLIHYLSLKYLRERAQHLAEELNSSLFDLQERFPIEDFRFSQRNHLLSHAAYNWLMGRPPLEIKDGALTFVPHYLEHRGELITKGAEWTLFGSHNIDGLRKLIQFLHSENYTSSGRPFDFVIVSFSRREQEDLKLMMKMLKEGKLGRVVVTSFTHPKAAPVEWMQGLAGQEGLEFVKDIDSYVQGMDNGKILVAGSYYFLGHVKSILMGR